MCHRVLDQGQDAMDTEHLQFKQQGTSLVTAVAALLLFFYIKWSIFCLLYWLKIKRCASPGGCTRNPTNFETSMIALLSVFLDLSYPIEVILLCKFTSATIRYFHKVLWNATSEARVGLQITARAAPIFFAHVRPLKFHISSTFRFELHFCLGLSKSVLLSHDFP